MHLSARGVTAPCSNLVPYLHAHQRPDTELDGLTVPDCGCTKMIHCGIILELDRNARTVSVSESHSTPLGAPGPSLQLDCILLFKGGGTQQNATAFGGNQYANLVCYLGIVTQSWVHFCWAVAMDMVDMLVRED